MSYRRTKLNCYVQFKKTTKCKLFDAAGWHKWCSHYGQTWIPHYTSFAFNNSQTLYLWRLLSPFTLDSQKTNKLPSTNISLFEVVYALCENPPRFLILHAHTSSTTYRCVAYLNRPMSRKISTFSFTNNNIGLHGHLIFTGKIWDWGKHSPCWRQLGQ